MRTVGLILIAIGGGIGAVFLLMFFYATSKRHELPESVVQELMEIPEVRDNQHRVDLELRDGRVVRRVGVAWGRYLTFSPRLLFRRFRASDVVHARPETQ
jgi:hypothetical protein